MKPRPVRAAALLCAVTVMLSGCTAGATLGNEALESSASAVDQIPLADLDVLSDPRSYVGETEVVLADTNIEPITDNPAQSLPATVTSHDSGGDVTVTVSDTSRIIGLDIAGSIGATLFGLGFGDKVVGRDISTTFPQAAGLPLVTGSAHTINAEAVLSLKPTVVITDGTIGPRDVVTQLRDAGVAVVFVNNEASLGGPAKLAQDVADALGAHDTGAQLADHLTQQIADKVAEIAAIAPKDESGKLRMAFLYLRGASGIYYLFGEGSGADALIDALGGIDVAAEIGWVGEKPMTAEAVVAADPDLILVMNTGLESVGGVDGLLAAKPEVALTTAGKNRRFVSMDDGQILSFGPRLPGVLDALARAIYAPGQ